MAMAERTCGQCINWRNGWCRIRKQGRNASCEVEYAGAVGDCRCWPCALWQAWPGLWNGDRSAWATDTDQTCEECDGTCSCGDCVAYIGKPCRFREPAHLDACGTQYRGCAPGCAFNAKWGSGGTHDHIDDETLFAAGQVDLTTDPLDIHSAWDPEQQRIETTFKVPVYDEETVERLRAAQELADTINADTTTPAVASVVDGAVRQDVPDPIEVRLVPDDDGLPPLAEGSRWDGTGVVDSTSTRTLVWIAEAHDQSGVWFTTEIESREHGAWLANVRNVIARHERANGIARDGQSDWWADRARELADKLDSESESHTVDAASNALAHAARSLRAILEELHAKGVC